MTGDGAPAPDGAGTTAFFGGLMRRIRGVVRRAAPVIGRIARVAAPIVGAIAAGALLRRRGRAARPDAE